MANQYRAKTGVKLYTQVLEQVKSMIAQGVYKKGDLLPSEKELIEIPGPGCCWNPPLPGRPPRPPPRRNWNSCARMSTRPCRWIVSTMCWWKWCITRW